MKWLLYEVFGISKQAYYQRIKSDKKQGKMHQIVLEEVASIRKKKPQTGTRKLMEELQPALRKNNIKMGRDALFDLLRYKGLLVRRTKRFRCNGHFLMVFLAGVVQVDNINGVYFYKFCIVLILLHIFGISREEEAGAARDSVMFEVNTSK